MEPCIGDTALRNSYLEIYLKGVSESVGKIEVEFMYRQCRVKEQSYQGLVVLGDVCELGRIASAAETDPVPLGRPTLC